MRALPECQSFSPLLPTAIVGSVLPSEKSLGRLALRQKLAELGYVGDRAVAVEYRWSYNGTVSANRRTWAARDLMLIGNRAAGLRELG